MCCGGSNQKKYLISIDKKMKPIILTLLATVSINCFSQLAGKNFIDQNYIEVTGKAEMEVIPNQVYLQIIVNEKDFKGKELHEIEQRMLAKLEKLGIDVSKNLTIKDMVSNFKNYWLKGSTINTTKEYQLEVDKAQTAGQVIQELASIGISNISIDRIAHSDIQKFRLEVKENAVKAAKEKASTLTKAIGQNIVKAIYIEELDYGISSQLRGRAMGLSNMIVQGYYAEAPRDKQPEIEFEKIKLQYAVLVRFSMH